MKTEFSKEEIFDFLRKKKDLIVGDEIISRITPDFSEFLDGISPLEVMAFVYKKGVVHGKIEGQTELMTELISFFEL
jgi:hypothetical protein